MSLFSAVWQFLLLWEMPLIQILKNPISWILVSYVTRILIRNQDSKTSDISVLFSHISGGYTCVCKNGKWNNGKKLLVAKLTKTCNVSSIVLPIDITRKRPSEALPILCQSNNNGKYPSQKV